MKFMTAEFCKTHLYPLLLALLCSIGCVSLVCAFFGLSSGILWFAVLFPLFLLPIHILSVNRKPFLFFAIFLPLSALIFYLVIRTAGNLATLIFSYTEWWDKDRSEQLPPHYLLLLLLFLFCISLIYLLQRNYICRLITLLLQLSALFVFHFFNYKTGKAAVVCFLGYFLFLLFETVFRCFFRSLKQTAAEAASPAYTAQLWPVVLTAMLLLAVIPHSDAPIRWNAIQNLWNTVTSAANDVFRFIRVDILQYSPEFSLKFSGYGNSGAIGGELFSTYTDSIHVRSFKRITDSVYLTGNTQNIYTGEAWESNLNIPDSLASYSDYYLDSAELSYAAVRAGLYQDHDNLYLANWYEMRFLDYHSSTLFAPAKTTKIEAYYPGDFSFSIDPDAIRFDRQMKPRTQYRAHYYHLNLGSDEFLSFASAASYAYDNSSDASYADLLRFSSEYRMLPDDESLDEIFRLRKNTIHENYLSLPAEVPFRVYELAVSLTEDKNSDYEKMLALEKYLQTFRYTTSPDDLPKDRELIDYFLFDSQEGYCTYFATALAVLGRCIGIPTRYVQGYCTRVDEYWGEWTLRSNNAHAWVEAYIDGLGWVPLDATPGYESFRYQPWHKKAPEITQAPSKDFSGWWSDMKQGTEPELPPEPVVTNDNGNWILGLSIILIAAVTMVALFALYILYRKVRLNRFLRNASLEDRFYYEAQQIFIVTGLLVGNAKTDSLFSQGTLTEFTEAFLTLYPEAEKHAKRFCNYYSDVRYGNHPVTQDYNSFALQYKSDLLLMLAREKGKQSILLYHTGELLRY